MAPPASFPLAENGGNVLSYSPLHFARHPVFLPGSSADLIGTNTGYGASCQVLYSVTFLQGFQPIVRRNDKRQTTGPDHLQDAPEKTVFVTLPAELLHSD